MLVESLWSWVRSNREEADEVQPIRALSFELLEPRLLLNGDLTNVQLLPSCVVPPAEPAVYVTLDRQDNSIQTDSLPFLTIDVTPCAEADQPVSSPTSSANATAQVAKSTLAGFALQDSSGAPEDSVAGLAVPIQQDLVLGLDSSAVGIRGPPNLPGLCLIDPDIASWQGQVIYLDFDGAKGITYHGPVTVGPFDVPAFSLQGTTLAGQEGVVITEIVSQLRHTFADTGVVFTTLRPALGTPYSTVYIGGDDSAFQQYGSFLGLAEKVDVGNCDGGDVALVFSERIAAVSVGEYAIEVALTAAHEVGHLVGMVHENARVDPSADGSHSAGLGDVAQWPVDPVFTPIPVTEDPSGSGLRSGSCGQDYSISWLVPDFYSFTAQAGDLLTVAADMADFPYGLAGAHYAVCDPMRNPPNNPVGNGVVDFYTLSDTGYGQSGPVLLTIPGEYQLLVWTGDYDYGVGYRVRVSLVPSATMQMETEGNDSLASANTSTFTHTVEMAPGQCTATIAGAITVGDGGDYYDLGHLVAGTAITLTETQPTTSGLLAVLAILDASGAVVASPAAGESGLSYTIPQGGDDQYYVRVTAANNTADLLSQYVLSTNLMDTGSPAIVADNLPVQGSSSTAVIDHLTLTFPKDMAPAAINDLSNLDLREAGPDGLFDTADDVAYHFASPGYTGGATVHYRIIDGPLQPGNYRLIVGTGAADRSGNHPTSAYVRTFSMVGVAPYVLEGRDTSFRGDFFTLGEPFPAGPGASSATTADLNADGKTDFLTANSGGSTISVFLGHSDGTFSRTDYAVGSNPVYVAVADIDGDGRSDLAVSNSGSGTVSLLRGNGDGTFQAPFDYAAGADPQWLVVTDLNKDGRPDLLATIRSAGAVGVWLNQMTAPGEFTADSFAPLELYHTGGGPVGMATGDFNRDGKTDVAVACPGISRVVILQGDGAGHLVWTDFPWVGASAPVGVVAADFNGDGRLDLATANYEHTTNLSVLLNQGHGYFANPSVYHLGISYSYQIAAGDLNSDSWPDLVLGSEGGKIEVAYNRGNGTFAEVVCDVPGSPTGVAVGDFDSDESEDIVVANRNGTATLLPRGGVSRFVAYVLESPHNHTPATATPLGPQGIGFAGFAKASVPFPTGDETWLTTAADLNADGKPDFVTANCAADTISVFLGKGDGTFGRTDYATSSCPVHAAVADFDGDGVLDLAVVNLDTISLLRGIGDGTFQAKVDCATGHDSEGVAVADLNKDGWPDLVVTIRFPDKVGVLLNQMTGPGDFTADSFAPVEVYAAGDPVGVDTGDFNGDGKTDVVVTNQDGNAVEILLGDGAGHLGSPNLFPVGAGTPVYVVTADFNGDANLDLATADYEPNNNFSVLLGDGDGTFAAPRVYNLGGSGWQIVAGDLNSDGTADLALGNDCGKVVVAYGIGDGTFRTEVYGLPDWPSEIVTSDFDGDGRMDIVVVNFNDTATLLRGEPPILLTEDPPGSGLRSGFCRGSLCDGTDLGYFSFTAQAGDFLTVAADTPGHPLGSALHYAVLDSMGNSIADFYTMADGGYGQSNPILLSAPGNYRVCVTDGRSAYEGEYRLRVTLAASASTQVETESNDSPGSANTPIFTQVVPQWSAATIAGAITTGDGGDYYDLGSIPAGIAITLTETQPTTSGLSVVLTIMDASGTVVVSSAGGGSHLSYTVPEGGDGRYYARVTAASGTAGLLSQYVLRIDLAVDNDADGLAINQEAGPAGNDPVYDGNDDGTPDGQQSNVASFETVTDAYVTLAAPEMTTLNGVAAVDNPSPADTPAGAEVPYGFFDFDVNGLTEGGAVVVDLYVPDGSLVNSYYKHGPTPDDPTPHWYEFSFDGTTGAVIDGNVIHLHFVDGLRGDDDLMANHTIVDPGSPAMVPRASITGTVFIDVNHNGLFEANEIGLDNVTVGLLYGTGTPVLNASGYPVTAITNNGGFYLFEDLAPGVYRLHEVQPAGFDDGAEILGSLDGAVVENDTMQLTLAGVDACDYCFTEFGQAIARGDTASIGFWQNKRGQELIRCGGEALANWLTNNFANVFGDALQGGNGERVAWFYKDQLFKQTAQKTTGPAKVDAQFMALALSAYFTSSSLAGDVAARYGFNVTATGIGTKIVNVGCSGAAFAVADGTYLTIMQLLLATNSMTRTDQSVILGGYAYIYDSDGDGNLELSEVDLRTLANEVYSAINESGDR